jgi:DNA-binding GntR family transcriptional regulator
MMNIRGRNRAAQVLLRLRRYAERGAALPKQTFLAREVGCSESALSLAMNRLQDDGRLRLEQRGMVRIVGKIAPE